MKKITNNLAILLVAAFLMAGCGGSLKKMADNANTVKYKVTPNPLEMHNEKVGVNISAVFPANYFYKKALLIVTPVLKSKDGGSEKLLKSFTIAGESFKDNYKTIAFKTGGSAQFSDTLNYEDIYRMSELELRIKASAGSENVNMISVKVADGIITTPRLVEQGMAVDNANADGTGYNESGSKLGKLKSTTVTLDPTSNASQEAVIFYELQKANIRTTEVSKQEVKDIVTAIKNLSTDTQKKFSGVKISSYASPDGPETMNASLVKERGNSAKDFLTKELKKQKVDAVKNANFVVTETTPQEDWEGFQKLTAASNLKDKELVLRVLSMYSDPIVREKEIKNISEAYTGLKDAILPKLRRSVMQIGFETVAKTDADMLSLANTNPDALKDKELFHAAEIATDVNQKVAIYQKYTAKYPNDWKGFNNLGVALAKQNKLADAKSAFDKARAIDAQNTMVLSNLGVINFAQNNLKDAEALFLQAKTDEANYNLGVIRIKQARYKDAIGYFGGNNSFNKALAQTLNGDNNGAENTLKAIGDKNIGLFFYLKAIVAAKAQKDDEAINFLKTAISKDAALKAYAKNDMEFIKLFEKDGFKAVIQ